MDIFGIKQLGFLTWGARATLGVLVGSANEPVQANSAAPQSLAQAGNAEPEDTCVPLQEVTTGQTEIRKRIENRSILGNNWHTDFIVPDDREFSYVVALITPANNGPYWMDNYTVEFTSAGQVFVQADCNRAIGEFRLESDNRMAVTMGPTTLTALQNLEQETQWANRFSEMLGELRLQLSQASTTVESPDTESRQNK